jgi:hypothetical protein
VSINGHRKAPTTRLFSSQDGQRPSSYDSLETKVERTAHYFDLDNTLTRRKYQYKYPETEVDKDTQSASAMVYPLPYADEKIIRDNIKPELAVTFRKLLAINAVVTIITRAYEYRAIDVLKSAGLTPEEIKRIDIYAEGKDEDLYDDNYKSNRVKDLIERHSAIKKHFYYDDDAGECMKVDSLDFPDQSITTYQVTRDPEEIAHFRFAIAVASNPTLRMKINESKPLSTRNDAVSKIYADEFNAALRRYSSTSCLSSTCFNPQRSIAMRKLSELSSKDIIDRDEIKAALRMDSIRRLNLFTGGPDVNTNGSSTDDVIVRLRGIYK